VDQGVHRNKKQCLWSEMGQNLNASRTLLCQLPPAADKPLECAPGAGQAEVSDRCSKLELLDHLVREGE
jgi:hypothetical protein